MKHSFVGELEKLESNVWNMFVALPDDIVQDFFSKNHKRVKVTFNDSISNQCAIMPRGNGTHFIMINKELRKKLGLDFGQSVKLTIEPDKSKYGLPMPEELEELLRQDPIGNKVFHLLTAGKQRTLLHLVGKPKGSETRLRKALVILDYLKEVDGKLDFKELNEAFKNSRY